MAERHRTYKAAYRLQNGDFVALQLDRQTLPHWWMARDVMVGREVVTFTAVRDGREKFVEVFRLDQMEVKELGSVGPRRTVALQ